MKIFLAGATGTIGRFLIPMLVSGGHKVVGMTRTPSKVDLLKSMGADAEVADALDKDSVLSAVRKSKPEMIVNELTDLRSSDYEATAKLRKEGTRNLVDAALDSGVTKIITQSYAVYTPGDGAATESDRLDLDSDWRTSVEGIFNLEEIASEVRNHVILRYGNLYGPGTSFSRSGSFASLVRQRKVAMTDDVTSFLHVQDAARAVVLGLEWPDGVVNIVDDEPAAATVWLPEYAKIIGAPVPATKEPSKHRQRGASNKKARHEYHWQPIYPTWRKGFTSELG